MMLHIPKSRSPKDPFPNLVIFVGTVEIKSLVFGGVASGPHGVQTKVS